MCGRYSRRNITELLAYLAAPTRYEVCTAGITYLIEEGRHSDPVMGLVRPSYRGRMTLAPGRPRGHERIPGTVPMCPRSRRQALFERLWATCQESPGVSPLTCPAACRQSGPMLIGDPRVGIAFRVWHSLCGWRQ